MEVTNAAHMGKNARMILGLDDKTKEMRIVHSNLEKEEALKLCRDGQYIVTNLLHFRKGASLINREEFNGWKKEYWKTRAAEIEKGIFIGKDDLPTQVIRKKLFNSPVIFHIFLQIIRFILHLETGHTPDFTSRTKIFYGP